MRTKFFILVLLMLLFAAPVIVNAASITDLAQTATPDCGQFTYSTDYSPAGCIAVYEFSWVPVSHGQGFTDHFEFPNNTSGNIRVADISYRNTARDGKVQWGSVVVDELGFKVITDGSAFSTLAPGEINTLDIVDTNCDLSSNLCTTPPPEMDLSVRVTYIVDPKDLQLLSSLTPPTVNVKDTLGGKLIWQYRYAATSVVQSTKAMSANLYVGGGTGCAIAAMNLDLGSAETAEIVAFLLDPQTGDTFDQGSFGLLLANQNVAKGCESLFPKITTLVNPSNFDLLVVTKALTSTLAIIVPQIGGGGGTGGFVTSQAVFPDVKGLQRLK